MARPTITYNASSGSDTAASGAGPATAVTGSGAAYSGDGAGGGTQTVITLTNTPDLSGVATDGSAALWLNTSSGDRHLFRITAVDDGADTVTVQTAPDTAINSGSAVDYAIGGKRKTLEADTSNADWDDVEAGWTFSLEAGTYTISSSITPPSSVGNHTDGPFTITSSNPGVVQPVIDRTGNFNSIQTTTGNHLVLDGIKFTRSSGAGNTSALQVSSGDMFIGRRLEIDAANMDIGITVNLNTFHLYDSEVYGADQSVSVGIDINDGLIRRCSIHDNGGDGVTSSVSSNDTMIIEDSVIYDNSGSGANIDAMGSRSIIRGNVFYGNSGDGLEVSDSSGTDNTTLSIEDNTFTSNGGYGVNLAADQVHQIASNKNNHYHGNTSGARNNLPAGTDDTSGDPLFTSVTDGSEDFTPTSGSPLLDAGVQAPTA